MFQNIISHPHCLCDTPWSSTSHQKQQIEHDQDHPIIGWQYVKYLFYIHCGMREFLLKNSSCSLLYIRKYYPGSKTCIVCLLSPIQHDNCPSCDRFQVPMLCLQNSHHTLHKMKAITRVCISITVRLKKWLKSFELPLKFVKEVFEKKTFETAKSLIQLDLAVLDHSTK